jgi:hypothetical protein
MRPTAALSRDPIFIEQGTTSIVLEEEVQQEEKKGKSKPKG